MAEMVVNGVSTRKASKIMETFCGKSFSKSAVSNVIKDPDKIVSEFFNRPLECKYPFLTVYATYLKVSESSRIISKAFMIAYGTNTQEHQEIPGYNIYSNGSTAICIDFIARLKKQGLANVLMITSDAHEGDSYRH